MQHLLNKHLAFLPQYSLVLVQTKGRNILIDTSPDLRMQLLDAEVDNIDLVLYTHDHADHVNGLRVGDQVNQQQHCWYCRFLDYQV